MVYFITDGEFIKIGKANDPNQRLSELQTGNPKSLWIIKQIKGDEKQERMLHQVFKTWHHRGEWFRANPAMLKKITELQWE